MVNGSHVGASFFHIKPGPFIAHSLLYYNKKKPRLVVELGFDKWCLLMIRGVAPNLEGLQCQFSEASSSGLASQSWLEAGTSFSQPAGLWWP